MHASHDKNKFGSDIVLQLRKNVVIIMRNYCLYDISLHIKTHYRLIKEVNGRTGKLSPEGSKHLGINWGIQHAPQ